MILNDLQIIDLAIAGMIDPFEIQKVSTLDGAPVLSYGLESFGYTIRLANEFRIAPCIYYSNKIYEAHWLNGIENEYLLDFEKRYILDVKNARSFDILKDFTGDSVVIPPNSYVLGRSVEYFKMPKDVVATALGKSTYARAGQTALVTPLEPRWKGYLTIEIANTSSLPSRVYAGEGVIQLEFWRGDYPSRGYHGNYQHQGALPVIPIVR